MALTRKTPLKRNTKPIARKTPLKASTKPIKRTGIKQKTYLEAKLAIENKRKDTTATKKAKAAIGPSKRPIPKLKAEADKWFSQYIRYRDGRYTHARGWETECITCNRWLPLKQMQAGHFVTRAINDLRFDEENVNGQCLKCNVFGAGEQYKYSVAVDIKYGEGTATALMSRRSILHKFTRQELEEIINDAKTRIEYYKREEDANVVNKKQPKEPTAEQKEAKKPRNTAITNTDEPANKKYQRRKINVVQK